MNKNMQGIGNVKENLFRYFYELFIQKENT